MTRMILATLLAALLSGPVRAEPPSAPTGPVVLTVSGAIDKGDAAGTVRFDRAALEALDGRKAVMETPWTEGRTEFSGPYLRAVLDAAGARGTHLRVIALNDYAADVPMEDATRLDTILATRMNGKPMSVREKGPLFLIYPFDTAPDLYNEKYFARSVWQIEAIEVVE